MPAGATPLDPDEAAGLLPGHIATREQLDEWEAENILEGQRWAAGAAKRRDLLDDAFLRELHKRMFGRTWKWAGAYRSTEKNLGVPREYAAFVVPLGATTKMDGCAAIYPAISAIFVAQFFGISLGIEHYLLIIFVSVIGSAATAGLTGATVMLTLTLSTLGLPLEGVGLLLAIDPILDMGRTAVNVAGQALVPTIVAKRQRILNQAVYDNGKAIEDLDVEAVPAE